MDAEIFRPERWDEDLPLFRDKTTQSYGYLPFSGGPRICLGSKCHVVTLLTAIDGELTRLQWTSL
jgi:cytochrome P450